MEWQWDMEWLVLAPIAIFIWVFPIWRIVAKAGYPPYVSLLAIVPFTALLLLWWLALARWPRERSERRDAWEAQ